MEYNCSKLANGVEKGARMGYSQIKCILPGGKIFISAMQSCTTHQQPVCILDTDFFAVNEQELSLQQPVQH